MGSVPMPGPVAGSDTFKSNPDERLARNAIMASASRGAESSHTGTMMIILLLTVLMISWLAWPKPANRSQATRLCSSPMDANGGAALGWEANPSDLERPSVIEKTGGQPIHSLPNKLEKTRIS